MDDPWETSWWHAEQALILAAGLPRVKASREWLSNIRVMSLPDDALEMDRAAADRVAEYQMDAWEILNRYRCSDRELDQDVVTVAIQHRDMALNGVRLRDVGKVVFSVPPDIVLDRSGKEEALSSVSRVSVTVNDDDTPFIRVVSQRGVGRKGPQPSKRYPLESPCTVTITGRRPSQRECTCDTDPCTERHRLESWQPHIEPLWRHFSHAVSGGSLKVGNFLGSMLFALYRDRGHLNEILSALHVCSFGELTAFPSCMKAGHMPWRIIARTSFRGSGSDTTWRKEQLYLLSKRGGTSGATRARASVTWKTLLQLLQEPAR